MSTDPGHLAALELDHQYTHLFEAWNRDLVSQIGRCARGAGKTARFKVKP